MYSFVGKIIKIGNSQYINIPKDTATQLGIGRALKITLEEVQNATPQ